MTLREAGWGSTLSSLVKPRLWALLHGRTPLAAQPPADLFGSRRAQSLTRPLPPVPLALYADAARCASRSLECFLRPLSTCPAELRLRGTAAGLGGRWSELTAYDAIVDRAPPGPMVDAARAAGRFSTVALLLADMLRPSAAAAAALKATRRALEWPSRPRGLMIGLHVRGGDACTPDALSRHNRTCSDLDAYLPALKALKETYAAADATVHVYLATDSERVAGAARRLERRGGDGFRWLLRSDVRRSWKRLRERDLNSMPQIEQQIKLGMVDGYRDALDAMVDVLLLAECDALVGKFSSNIDRIAYSLMSVRRGGGGGGARVCLPPYISTDHPWCSDYSKKIPLTPLPPQPFGRDKAVVNAAMGRDAATMVVGGFLC